jgi:hypothetical protein
MERLVSKMSTEARLSRYLGNAEEAFASLMVTPELDELVLSQPSIIGDVDDALTLALAAAYGPESDNLSHLFLQRILYRINRVKFFWYDDLSRYENERSEYLRAIRNRVESAWAQWELSLLTEVSDEGEVSETLRRRAAADLAPLVSADGLYFRSRMKVGGYRRLLKIASLDGLVEASQLSRTLGGVGNEIHSMMTRLLVEEYGGGRLERKHSSFFRVMLEELDIDARPEAHLDIVPWQVLATINHSFLMSERKRYYLRYVGGLLYTETSVPAAFENYRVAAERLGMSARARGYWDLHIKEDERHGRWMLNDIAVPLARLYPHNASELLLGYDQQKFMSERAGEATAAAVRQVDNAAQSAVHDRGLSFEVAA